MPPYCVSYIGALEDEVPTALDSKPESYVVTRLRDLDNPVAQLAETDCVVAVHDPPQSDAREILHAIQPEVRSLPVVIYAKKESADAAIETMNAGASRYVRATDENSGQRLATAITEVIEKKSLHANTNRNFRPSEIVHNLPTAAFVLNEDHEVVYWNEVCANLLECDPGEVLGTTEPFKPVYDEPRPVLADLVLEEAAPEEISRWYDTWYESLYAEDVLVGEDYFPKQDLWLRFAAVPLTDASGNVVGAVETLEEITKRKQRELELERYEMLVEASGDPVYLLDAEGKITFVNNNLAEMTGYEKDELLGSDVSMVLSEADIEKTERQIAELLSSEERQTTVEMDVTTRSGDRRTCENHIALLPSNDGFRGTVGILRDITERKARERELRQFKNAVANAGYAIMITGPDGVIEYVNPAFEEMTGYQADDAIGATPRILKSGEQSQEFYAELWETILAGETWQGELINRRQSGERFIAHETIAPIEGPDGDITGFVGIQDEITTRRLRQQQLEVFHRVLRHDLRNKGTAIKGHTELLEQELATETSIERLETIQQNVQSLLDTSEKAHHIRQIVADALTDHAETELMATLERVRRRLSSSYPEAEISLEGDSSQSLEIDSRVSNAFRELVENAVRHSNETPPRVTITVSVDSTTATVTVSDNGPGIPEEEQHVLEAGTETPLEHSSGLGLWFVHWLIHFAGGDIDIQVEEGGTSVRVTLPIRSPTTQVS